MNLADHIAAAPDTGFDTGYAMSSMARFIEKSQRFEMSDDVVTACVQLVDSKPSTLLAALPICRLPYDSMWIEYKGGCNAANNTRNPAEAPIPDRQGFLIQSMPKSGGRIGYATLAWVHKNFGGVKEIAPFTSPFAIYFDWREDGDVRQLITAAHKVFLSEFKEKTKEHYLLQGTIKWVEKLFLGSSKDDEIQRFFMLRSGWEKFANNQVEIEAMRQAENHMMAGLSPHGIHLILEALNSAFDKGNADLIRKMFSSWLSDIQGEGCFMECFLAMLNSRNCIEQEPVDLSRLNKARKKRGKRPLLDYTKTKIVLSRTHARMAHARGIDREEARLHLVRGHFKIRRTGVYWWSSFTRGNPLRGEVRREEYEVT